MAFDGPAGLPCDGAKPFHARPFPFVEAVGGEYPPMGGEKRVAGLQKRRQLRGGVEEASACKSIADNDIVLRTVAVGFGETITKCNGKVFRIAAEKPFAGGVMRQTAVTCHPDFQMFGRDADGGSTNGVGDLRKFIRAQPDAATEIKNADRPALPRSFDEIANLLQLCRIAVVRRAETGRIGDGAEQREEFVFRECDAPREGVRQHGPEIRKGQDVIGAQDVRHPVRRFENLFSDGDQAMLELVERQELLIESAHLRRDDGAAAPPSAARIAAPDGVAPRPADVVKPEVHAQTARLFGFPQEPVVCEREAEIGDFAGVEVMRRAKRAGHVGAEDLRVRGDGAVVREGVLPDFQHAEIGMLAEAPVVEIAAGQLPDDDVEFGLLHGVPCGGREP